MHAWVPHGFLTWHSATCIAIHLRSFSIDTDAEPTVVSAWEMFACMHACFWKYKYLINLYDMNTSCMHACLLLLHAITFQLLPDSDTCHVFQLYQNVLSTQISSMRSITSNLRSFKGFRDHACILHELAAPVSKDKSCHQLLGCHEWLPLLQLASPLGIFFSCIAELRTSPIISRQPVKI